MPSFTMNNATNSSSTHMINLGKFNLWNPNSSLLSDFNHLWLCKFCVFMVVAACYARMVERDAAALQAEPVPAPVGEGVPA